METIKTTNRILAALPLNEYRNLQPKLERVSLNFAEIIYDPGDVISHIYFPESGIVSLLSTVEKNSTLEVGIVGNEGIIGLPVFLGVATSNNRAIVQGAGFALKMATAHFLKESRRGELPKLLQRFVHSLIVQISQSAVCNRFHQIEARLAKWLLMTADRMPSVSFKITQEFLSNMLGVRREAVNIAVRSLHKQQLISYSRGKLLILNQNNLETAACSCYQIIKKDYLDL